MGNMDLNYYCYLNAKLFSSDVLSFFFTQTMHVPLTY